MPARTLTQVASRLRRETAVPATETDRDLLTRFLDDQDETAFETLVRRHDRLVRSAIAKVLADPHDAEDAFQATFLVLVRRAKSIDWRAGLGPWLYGVAHRVAVKARAAGQTRNRKEKEAQAQPSESEVTPDLSWREACALLHDELDQLPDRYRLPLLLCYLEGKSRDEAAVALKVTVGTVKGRLERGRELLRARLARRGVALSAGLLAAIVVGPVSASSAASVSGVLAVVRGAAPARILDLTREATAITLLSKLAKTVAGVFGVVVLASAILAAGAPQPGTATDEKEKTPAPKTDAPAPPAPGDKKDAPKAVTFVVNVLVKFPSGTPAANANVSVWAERKKQVAGKTDEKGRLELIVPTFFPKVVVVATAPVVPLGGPDLAPDWAEFSPVFLGKQVIGAPTELNLGTPGPALEGRVTDLEGRPVANLPVDVERIGRPKPGKTLDDHLKINPEYRSRGITALFDLDSISTEAAGLPTRVTTDKDGKFKLTGVGKDRSVRLTTRGETTEHLQVRVVTRALDAKLEQPGPFGLHGSTFTLRVGPTRPIVGTVRDAKTGDPVPGMKIAELIGHLCETTTDKDGKFKLVGVAKAARYMLGTGSLGESPYFDANLLIDDPAGLGAVTADFKVHRGVVATGRVLDSAGKPVAGSVFYDWTGDNPHLKDYPGLRDAQVRLSHWGNLDRDGRYKLLVIPGRGAVGVCASPEDAFPRLATEKELQARGVWSFPSDALHAVTAVNFDPKDAKTLTHDFTLTIGKGRDLIIRGVAGKLPEKLLAVGQHETNEPRLVTGDTLRLGGLSPKQARAVVLFDEAKTVGAVAGVTGDAETPATVNLEKLGSISGRVFDADGAPAAGAEVRVWLELDRAKFDNLPDEVFTQAGVSGIEKGAWQHFTSRTAKTDQTGRFTLTGLLPGHEYRLRAGFNAEKQGGELLHQRGGVTVKVGEAKDLGDLKPRK
jgi:RNA polymerase sigma factor (sigma-70 family)